VPYALGFLLFRVADILKPWPASWADRRVGGGFGVMLDDAIAAVYAAALLVLILSLWRLLLG
jgi:phosphatidylglycerophosphatase A